MTVKKLIKADRLGDAVPPAEQWDYGKWYVVKAGTRPGPYGSGPRIDWSKLKWAKKLSSFKFETIKRYLNNLDVFGVAPKPSPSEYKPKTNDSNGGGDGPDLQSYEEYVQSHDVKRVTGADYTYNGRHPTPLRAIEITGHPLERGYLDHFPDWGVVDGAGDYISADELIPPEKKEVKMVSVRQARKIAREAGQSELLTTLKTLKTGQGKVIPVKDGKVRGIPGDVKQKEGAIAAGAKGATPEEKLEVTKRVASGESVKKAVSEVVPESDKSKSASGPEVPVSKAAIALGAAAALAWGMSR